MLSSLLYGLLASDPAALLPAAASSAAKAVTQTLSLCGTFALWSGLLNIAAEGGMLSGLARLMLPVIKRLFPGAVTPSAREAIAANLTANLLGMGNAATPAGRRAIAELAACSPAKGKVTADMIMLLVLNNSALTLLPTTVLTLRAAAGSADAAGILPASLAASAVSTVLFAVELFEASGLASGISSLLSDFLLLVGLPEGLGLFLLIRPLSGSGALAELGRIFSLYGPDSSQGIFASVFMGSTETIFYTVPVYLSAARLKSSPKAIIISLISMLAGLVTALLILNLS